MADTVHTHTRHGYEETALTVPEILVRITLFILAVIEVFIGARFLLELLGANPASPFVLFVYRISGVFMAPFNAVFPTEQLARSIFDWSALVAMVVYALIAWGVMALIRIGSPDEHIDVE